MQIRDLGGVLDAADIPYTKDLLDKYDWSNLPIEFEPPLTSYLFKELTKHCKVYWRRKFNRLYRKLTNGKI